MLNSKRDTFIRKDQVHKSMTSRESKLMKMNKLCWKLMNRAKENIKVQLLFL